MAELLATCLLCLYICVDICRGLPRPFFLLSDCGCVASLLQEPFRSHSVLSLLLDWQLAGGEQRRSSQLALILLLAATIEIVSKKIHNKNLTQDGNRQQSQIPTSFYQWRKEMRKENAKPLYHEKSAVRIAKSQNTLLLVACTSKIAFLL